MTFQIGDRIGDYEILSVLGAGGMGKVYKVRNVISERVEAMKVLLPNLESDPDLADLGLGLTIAQKGPFALSAVYDYTFGQTSFDNQFFLRLKTEF